MLFKTAFRIVIYEKEKFSGAVVGVALATFLMILQCGFYLGYQRELEDTRTPNTNLMCVKVLMKTRQRYALIFERAVAQPPAEVIQQHQRRLHRSDHRIKQAADRLCDHEGHHHEQDEPVGQGTKDLGATVAEGLGIRCRPRRHAQCDERHQESGQVGEHVACVGEERKRAGENTADHLDHENDYDDPDRNQQARPIRSAGLEIQAVRVAVPTCVVHRSSLETNAGQRPHRDQTGKTSSVLLAVAMSLPLESCTVPSAKAARLPGFVTMPTAVSWPVSAITGRR